MTAKVSETILNQLGGSKFVAMTGAKAFVGSVDSLSFRVPGTLTKNRANVVRVTLLPSDLYLVAFMSLRGSRIRTVSQFDGLYADQLAEVFTRETGLATRL